MSWVWFLNVIYSAPYGDDCSDNNNNKVSIPLQLNYKYMYTCDHQHHHVHVVHHFIQKSKSLTKVSPAEHFFFSFQTMLSLVIIDVLHETHALRAVGYCSVHSVTLSPVPSVRGFPLLSEVFNLPLVFYLCFFFFIVSPISQFHSPRLLANSPAPWCEWARVLCEQICRWVIDRVHTLNVAGVGLHFLCVLLLKRDRELSCLKTWLCERGRCSKTSEHIRRRLTGVGLDGGVLDCWHGLVKEAYTNQFSGPT